MPLTLVLIAGGATALSGVPGLFTGWRSRAGQGIATLLAVSSAIAGFASSLQVLIGAETHRLRLPWALPGASFEVELDALSAFFLLLIFLMSALGSVYGQGYWAQESHPSNGRRLRFFWGLLIAGLVFLVVARDAVLFLFGWEIMAVSAFFLVGTEDRKEEVREASLIYLVAAHLGTLFLLAMFALLHSITGSFSLRPLQPGEAGLGRSTAIFFLALVGFGIKAGMMPLHVWLPPAHANAPSHVSAVLSGVVLKVGIYGLVRFTGLLPSPPSGWGWILLIFGTVSGILGVAFALGQHDLKRLLAYHSVENIGIILMGLGVAMLGRSMNRPLLIALGLGGCLLHVWNHGLFKSLLFLSAGSVVHAAGTREIDRLGGLSRRMPWTAFFFLWGALAICGLPPLNGFVSELLIYLGLFKSEGAGLASLGIPALAMIGALALACFVKAYGAVFLGHARTSHAERVHESTFSMQIPMGILAAACGLIGLAPGLMAPWLDGVIRSWAPDVPPDTPALSTLVPFDWITAAGIGLFVLVVPWLALARSRGPSPAPVGTWDCGYAAPSARMQYSASSFAQTLVGLFRWALRPRSHRPQSRDCFPSAERLETHVDDVVLKGWIGPLWGAFRGMAGRLHAFQQGQVQRYILYVLLTVVVLLVWILPFDRYLTRLFSR